MADVTPTFKWLAIICPEKNLLLTFKSSLCIFDNSPLSAVSLANIFSQSVSCLPILMDCALDVVSKKLSPNPRTPRFSPVLSPSSFIVSCFAFESMIHFEVLF